MTHARRILVIAALGVALSGAAAGQARADQVKFIGIHPISGGGFCYIEAAHVHVYAPAASKERVRSLYRVHDGHYHFVGDPVGFGYKGPKKTYYGHHPVAVDVVVGAPAAQHHTEFCYLDGPHYHYYEPPADISFVVDGGAYWYAGAYPPAYERDRAALVTVNAVYAPIVYERPVVTVAPPAVYLGPVVVVKGKHGRGHGHGHGHVGVGVGVSAGVEVHVPAPRLEVGISVPGVIIVDDHHHHHKRKHKHKKWKRHHRDHDDD
jgi:hypothetical protein